ncbi:methyl-accepting chemotaxis protein [Methylobacterium planeticum]|uniref:Methyl-accepting chemotaxis protein n=1 Tax=Methylobacterium planeticum TaxID=2615211 RepID=A0A6N6MJY4_9HYPH|nr:methyl-accepting chemotaxis protein [Methylobacterium planeticum]KAB1071470.1 methyl-accepting chemotaxis protein [Methylobacterium planeticum]
MSISIGNRILLGFVAITLVIVALGIYALGQIGAVRDTTDAIVSRDLSVARKLDDLGNRSRDMGILRRNAVIAAISGKRPASDQEDPAAAWRRAAGETEALLAALARTTDEYRATSVSPERAVVWRRLNEAANGSVASFRQLRSGGEAQLIAIAAKDIEAVEARNDELTRSQDAFLRGVDRTRDLLDEGIAAGQRGVRDIYERSRLSIILTLLASVVLSILVTILISRAVVRPLEKVMEFADRVGSGDLSGTLDIRADDEIGRLGRTLNGMVAGLADLARTNRAATADLNAAAAEIRASAQEQAASVEEQFAAVQETAATVDEITHSGAQITKRAGEVIATAQATAQTSKAGLRAVADTARAMEAIREQAEAVAGNIVALSEKTQTIGEIITTVNDISERTHLLALNAAIEAAAAGEGGRSFAVVAAEMKLLADQAKGATAQVRTILGEIQRGINTSVMLTEEAVKRAATGKTRSDTTQRAIEEITARVEESVQTFQQIVASTNQQQLGIEQVMGALQNIRQASQQTAAGTREVEAASANLTELAQALMALAERYRH